MEAFHGRGLRGCIFQGPHGDVEPVAGNTQRKWRGVPEECVSVLLGHASTATTARYYARTRERSAIAAVRESWEMSSETSSETASGTYSRE